jgi:hypothetical protein
LNFEVLIQACMVISRVQFLAATGLRPSAPPGCSSFLPRSSIGSSDHSYLLVGEHALWFLFLWRRSESYFKGFTWLNENDPVKSPSWFVQIWQIRELNYICKFPSHFHILLGKESHRFCLHSQKGLCRGIYAREWK